MIRLERLHQRSAKYASALLLAASISAYAAPPVSDESRIEVDAEQRATVTGAFASLKKVLEELCREA